jgi:hypothetical protein
MTDDWSPTKQNKRIMFAYVKFKNYGKSPAWITEEGGSFDILKNTADLPPIPVYRDKVALRDRTAVIVPLGTADDSETLRLPQPEEQQIPVPLGLSKEGVCCFYGYIKYKDVFGQTHETRFCYRQKDPIQAAPLEAGPNYTLHT